MATTKDVMGLMAEILRAQALEPLRVLAVKAAGMALNLIPTEQANSSPTSETFQKALDAGALPPARTDPHVTTAHRSGTCVLTGGMYSKGSPVRFIPGKGLAIATPEVVPPITTCCLGPHFGTRRSETRNIPPTLAEIRAHMDAGGSWLSTWGSPGDTKSCIHREPAAMSLKGSYWTPLDKYDIPTTWPIVL